MNQWDAFNEYQEEQRQQRLAKEQAIAEELQAKQLEAIELLKERNQELQSLKEQAKESRQTLISLEEKLHPIEIIARELKKQNERRQKVIERLQERQHINKKEYTTSPLEIAFYRAWIEIDHEMPVLAPQYQIGRFRVDFAHVESMTVIEIDGHDFHSSRKDRNRDYQRQREIENAGWFFVRFTGSEVFASASSCANLVYERIMARLG